MTFGKGVCWPSRRDELLDAATGGYSMSLLTVGHGVWVSRIEELAVTFGEGGCWPSRHDELLDVAAGGHSMSLLVVGHGVWVYRT